MKPIVAVIGDRHCEPNTPKAILAFQLGKALVDAGYRVITGGLGSCNENDDGVMEFAMKGAKSSSNYHDGDTIGIIPGFSSAKVSRYVDIVIPTGLDIYRNGITANADAVIAIGGGAGTLGEMALAWSLFRLIIAFDNVDGWSSKLAGEKIDNRTRYNDIPDDKVYGVSSIKEVIDIINNNLARYTKRHTMIV
ncbi:MAG: hypothetical protein MJZ65_01540 [Paludibacteraceae bacterium]|nr:hypothetical protein [Paludibacteraceae bacterium]